VLSRYRGRGGANPPGQLPPGAVDPNFPTRPGGGNFASLPPAQQAADNAAREARAAKDKGTRRGSQGGPQGVQDQGGKDSAAGGGGSPGQVNSVGGPGGPPAQYLQALEHVASTQGPAAATAALPPAVAARVQAVQNGKVATAPLGATAIGGGATAAAPPTLTTTIPGASPQTPAAGAMNPQSMPFTPGAAGPGGASSGGAIGGGMQPVTAGSPATFGTPYGPAPAPGGFAAPPDAMRQALIAHLSGQVAQSKPGFGAPPQAGGVSNATPPARLGPIQQNAVPTARPGPGPGGPLPM
jgi:hypothetical protein